MHVNINTTADAPIIVGNENMTIDEAEALAATIVTVAKAARSILGGGKPRSRSRRAAPKPVAVDTPKAA